MAETIVITCPECKKQLKGSEDLQGKKIRCKGCGHVFAVSAGPEKPAAKPKPAPAAAKPAPAKPKPADDEWDNLDAYGVKSDTETAPLCPHCANEMPSADAILCLNCGYNTRSRQRVGTKKVVETTPGERLMWLLPGIGSFLFIFVLIGFDLFYCMKLPRLLEDGDWEWLGHGGFKLWVVIFSIGGMFLAAKFAVKRLILHPTPPEKMDH